MKIVEVNTKEVKKIPGYTTEITPGRWRGMIDTLLYELDELEGVSVERQAWLREKGITMPTLVIEILTQVGNVERRFQLQIEPVLIRRMKKVGGRYGKNKLVDEERASWKLFHDLMKLKFTAARLGVVEVHHEFMSYIAKRLPDDSVGTFADFMDVVIQRPEGLEGLQLEDQREAKVIEAEVVERGK